MTKEQENAFWQTIKVFNEIGLLQHVMVIGSWAEYLYPSLFETDFVPNLKTRDVDFFYRNINIPKEKIPLIEKLKEIGYVYDEVDGISRFYKEDLLELEFLTRVLGAGVEGNLNDFIDGKIEEIRGNFPLILLSCTKNWKFCAQLDNMHKLAEGYLWQITLQKMTLKFLL